MVQHHCALQKSTHSPSILLVQMVSMAMYCPGITQTSFSRSCYQHKSISFVPSVSSRNASRLCSGALHSLHHSTQLVHNLIPPSIIICMLMTINTSSLTLLLVSHKNVSPLETTILHPLLFLHAKTCQPKLMLI